MTQDDKDTIKKEMDQTIALAKAEMERTAAAAIASAKAEMERTAAAAIASAKADAAAAIASAKEDMAGSFKPVAMVVTDSDGKTDLPGTPCVIADDNAYQFYAKVNTLDGDAPFAVSMTIPMGGPQSGLFRFPLIGEKVLAYGGDAKYFMGFVPSTDETSFYPMDAELADLKEKLMAAVLDLKKKKRELAELQGQGSLSATDRERKVVLEGDTDGSIKAAENAKKAAEENLEKAAAENSKKAKEQQGQANPATMHGFLKDNGMALRYKRAAETGTGAFSEIGFYQKLSKWPATVGKTDYPNQDTINIQSTGDIESRAENYQLLKAKRFEILVNTPELLPKERYDNANSDNNWDSGKAPIGDSPLDDPMIHSGDLHVRAARSIVIKADNEIKLQVGRTVVTINDGGFSVVTQKTNSSVGLSYDTSFSMNPRSGISMSGQKVNINSINGFALGDSWGAGVNGSIGGLNLSGRFIKQSNMDSLSALFMQIANTFECGQNIGIGARTVLHDGSQQQLVSDNYISNAVETLLINDVASIFTILAKDSSFAKRIQPDRGDPPAGAPPIEFGKYLEFIEGTTLFLDMILKITNMVYTSIDTNFSIQWRADTRDNAAQGKDLNFSSADKSTRRDNLNLCALAIDDGIIAAALDVCIPIMLSNQIPGSSGSIRLRPSGDVVIKAAKYVDQYGVAHEQNASTTTFLTESTSTVVNVASALAKLGTDIAKVVSSGKETYERVKPWLEKL